MTKNKGTIEGTEAEINFVQNVNLHKDTDNDVWNTLINSLSLSEHLSRYHVIRVTKKVLSSLNNKKVLPKADCFIAEGEIPPSYINKHSGGLDENNTRGFNLRYIHYSGISIKRPDSQKYQILKMRPDSFRKLIGNYESGAGASIYCTKIEEIKKNSEVLKGWHTTWNELFLFFKPFIPNIEQVISTSISDNEKLSQLKKIKTKANEIIKNEILSDDTKKKMAFQGIGLYPEPYPAYFIFEKNEFRVYVPYDFNVTTGSGRSKGDFTIVLKPV